MKTNVLRFCIALVFAFISQLNLEAANLMIFKEKGRVVCRNAYSLEEVYSDENSANVILFALEQLKEKDGGNIHIGAGEYLLDQPLVIGNNTTLKGDGISTKLKFIGKKSMEGGILVNRSDGVTISEVLVSQTDESEIDAGIIVDDSGVCKITNVYAIGFKKYGIWLRNRTFLSKIDGCIVAGNSVSNIYLDGLSKDGRYGNFIPNLITNSIIFGGGKGIEARNALVTHIIGCMIHQTNGNAIHLHSISNSILISGCRTYQISDDAVVVENTDELNVSGNIISWHEGNGIVVKNSAWGNISGNEFTDTGSYNPNAKDQTVSVEKLPEGFEGKDAILMANVTGFHVGGNTIFNWGVCPKMKYGIEEDSLSHNNIISDNNINYFRLEGVKSSGSGTILSNNLSEGDIPYTRIKKYTDKHVKRSFDTAVLQSYETKLTEEFIDSLK